MTILKINIPSAKKSNHVKDKACLKILQNIWQIMYAFKYCLLVFFYGYCYFINFNEKNLRDEHISSLFCKCWYTSTNIYLIHNCLQQCSGTCNSRFTVSVRKMLFFKQQFFSLVLFLFYVHICQVNTCMNRIDVTEM